MQSTQNFYVETIFMAEIILLNKPFNVLSQFTDADNRATLSDYIAAPGFRAAGRLDYDSEGLLVLTNNGAIQDSIASPRHKLPKTYWAQVEGMPTYAQLEKLAHGVMLNDGITKPAMARQLEAAEVWERNPPIRHRLTVPTAWIELEITEGRNRQVRRMTAAVGLPTLRLIRIRIGPWSLEDLAPGEWRRETVQPPPKSTSHPPTSQLQNPGTNSRQPKPQARRKPV